MTRRTSSGTRPLKSIAMRGNQWRDHRTTVVVSRSQARAHTLEITERVQRSSEFTRPIARRDHTPSFDRSLVHSSASAVDGLFLSRARPVVEQRPTSRSTRARARSSIRSNERACVARARTRPIEQRPRSPSFVRSFVRPWTVDAPPGDASSSLTSTIALHCIALN